ncbi:MAG: hypothetical protein ABI898_05000 [Sphingomonadales bacterium]
MVSDRRNGIYRSVVIAAFGWLSVAASNPPKEATQANNTGPQREISNAANTVASAITEAAKPPEKDGGCNEGQDERHSDLCAQWKAADAAREAADYSFWTLLISAVGTSLLIWTLWETRETSRRELRAYLMVDTISASMEDDGFVATLRWLNCGQTPAHIVRVAIKLDIGRVPNFKTLSPLQDGSTHLGSGKGFKSIQSLSVFEFHGHTASDEQIWLYARVTYADIFGRSHKTDVCLQYAGGSEFQAGPCNNVAT